MICSSAAIPQKTFSLTEEEAFALLEMCTLTLATDKPAHSWVLSRLGSFCREWLKQQPANAEH